MSYGDFIVVDVVNPHLLTILDETKSCQNIPPVFIQNDVHRCTFGKRDVFPDAGNTQTQRINRSNYVISSSQNTRNDLLFKDLVIKVPAFKLNERKRTLLKFARKFNLFDFELFENYVNPSTMKIFPFFLFKKSEENSGRRNITRLFDDEPNIFVQHLCNIFFQGKITLDEFLDQVFEMTPSFQHVNVSNLYVLANTALPISMFKHIFPQVKLDFHKFHVEWINHPPLDEMHDLEHDVLVVFQDLKTSIFGPTWAHVYFALFMLSRTVPLSENCQCISLHQEKFIVFRQFHDDHGSIERSW